MPVFGTAGARGVFNSSQTPERGSYTYLIGVRVWRGSYGVAWGWGGRVRRCWCVLLRGPLIGWRGQPVLFGLVPTPVTAYGAREEGCRLGFSVGYPQHLPVHHLSEFPGVHVRIDHHRPLYPQFLLLREFHTLAVEELHPRILRRIVRRRDRETKPAPLLPQRHTPSPGSGPNRTAPAALQPTRGPPRPRAPTTPNSSVRPIRRHRTPCQTRTPKSMRACRPVRESGWS